MVANSNFMAMYWFFTDQIKGQIIHLQEDEARHCSKVLRMQVGDEIHALDGQGNRYTATIQSLTKKEVQAIISNVAKEPPNDYSIHLAIAPTKNIGRLEWFLEKVCELGVTSISPILCQRSERKLIKQDRLQKIIMAAAKQSQKAYFPSLYPLRSLKDYLSETQEGEKFICHCAYEENTHLAKLYKKGKSVHVLIGPEGDFHNEEVEMALAAGFKSAGLGKERLRTETAGVYACSIVHTVQSFEF